MSESLESKILSRIKEDHLTCQICHGPYEEPKALPCLHTFCCQCLQDYIYSRRYEAGSKFPCPMCRIQVELSKLGVEAFPDNHLVITLMDTVAGENSPTLDETVVLGVKNDNLNRPTIPTPFVSPPSTGIYPRLSPFLERRWEQTSEQTVNVVNTLHRRRIQVNDCDLPPYNCPTVLRPIATDTPTVLRPAPPKPHRINEQPDIIQRRQNQMMPTGDEPIQRKMVLSSVNHPVQLEKNKHGAILGIGQFGTYLTDFERPVGLAISPEGYIIVGDQRDNRVFIFERTGTLRTMFTCQGKIHDISTNAQGSIYIANTHARKSMVVCFNNRGHTIATFGNMFTYEKPHGIAVMSNNHMVITSTETNLAYILNEYGKMTHEFTGKGKDGKRLSRPYHVAISRKDKIIISDYGNDCVKVFDNNLKCKVQFGKTGNKPGQFNGPRGVCVDRDNNIVVCDAKNHRVQVFTSKGQFIRTIVQMTSIDMRVGAAPVNVAMTPDNKLVVLFFGSSYAQVRVYTYHV